MKNTNLFEPRFQDADEACKYLEALHWPHGPVCPHCGSGDNQKRLEGCKHRPGLVQCNNSECRKQYTVTVGTVFERSKVPLNKWLLATHLMCASKKGMSAHQLHRMLGVTYKTAWFMAHRIREAMTPSNDEPMVGGGSTVEVDETYFGKDKSAPKSRTPIRNMNKIVSLVDRVTGRASSVVFTEQLTSGAMQRFLFTRVDRKSKLMSDEAHFYKAPGKAFAKHKTVNHRVKEYVRGDVTTNTVEGFFGIFKRGMRGVYQHCGQQHLHRYVAEFDFRYSNRSGRGIEDRERADIALKGIIGKRLTYRRIGSVAATA